YDSPAGLALDQYRNLYIADTGNNRVVVLQPNFEDGRSGTYQAVFPNPMPAGAGLSQPSGLAIVPQRAVDDDEFLAVADTGNSRVQVFRINITGSASGTGFTNSIRATTAIARNITITALTTFGAAGNADDQFQKPVDIASDRNRRLYVCDAGLNRISRWSLIAGPAYSHDVNWGKAGGGPSNRNGEFNRPSAIAVDSKNGYAYVADVVNRRFQRLDTETGNFRVNWRPEAQG